MTDKKRKNKKKPSIGFWQTLIGVTMVAFGLVSIYDAISIPLVSLTKAFAKGAITMQGVFLILWGFREMMGGIFKSGRNR